MGVLSDIIRQKDKYHEISSDVLDGEPFEQTTVAFLTVRSKDDINKVEQALRDNKIVFVDVAYVESKGIKTEDVITQLETVSEKYNGDILHKKNNHVIVVAPQHISIQRTKL